MAKKLSPIIESSENRELVLQGNVAFALGAIHAGFHAADGYPGTPSTEVVEALIEVPTYIQAGWSVNEAVAVGVAVGHSMAGRDTLVTMKVPGLFQAGDVVATSAFSDVLRGALVIYIATDHKPSSTQYLVDARDFLASLKLPIIEPRSHQELYAAPSIAADMSRREKTPVIVLASSVLAHSQGNIQSGFQRIIHPQPAYKSGEGAGIMLPSFARTSFDKAVQKRIPRIKVWSETSSLVTKREGNNKWGIITCGEATAIVLDTFQREGVKPTLLSLGITNPLPIETIRSFIKSLDGNPCYLFEDGERFVERQLAFEGIRVIGKEQFSTITNWTPEAVIEYCNYYELAEIILHPVRQTNPVIRPALICPGCPYQALSEVLQKLKKQKKLDLIFGDIGCSTLLSNYNALDINFCMGASESIRQGFTLSKPEMAQRVVSVIGDSSECHSGMDATRNGLFKGSGGVKIILDNSAVAMTGCQISPTSKEAMSLVRSLEGEGINCKEVNSYDIKDIAISITTALDDAVKGKLTALVLKAPCLFAVSKDERKKGILTVDEELCIKCNKCQVCPAIELNSLDFPQFNATCTRCGAGAELCRSLCPVNAIIEDPLPMKMPFTLQADEKNVQIKGAVTLLHQKREMESTLRMGIRGVGGQGVLFISKVLSSLIQNEEVYKGSVFAEEVHGMAQKGGEVFASFAAGAVSSPLLQQKSVDILIALEYSELLRPGFIDLLKPNGIIIIADYALKPVTKSKEYPSLTKIREYCRDLHTIEVHIPKELHREINVIILGVLSKIPQFQMIEKSNWVRILRNMSPTDVIRKKNTKAFETGWKAVDLSIETYKRDKIGEY